MTVRPTSVASSTRILVGSLGLVAYTFAGYPALMALLSRLRPRPVETSQEVRPKVSIVVAAYNEEDVIVSRLENLRASAYPVELIELIVAADGSQDRTVARAQSVPGTIVLHRPERLGKLAAIGHAWEVASGDILVVTDANNKFAPETLRELTAPFADGEVGVVTGRKAIDDGTGRPLDRAEGVYWRYESKLKEWETTVGSVPAVAGEILAFRRAAFQVPDEPLLTEDFAQAMLAALDGWRVVYAPRALSMESASATVGDEAVRRARLVTGRWQALLMLLPPLLLRRPWFALQLISHKGLRPLVPAMLVTAASSNLVAARQSGWPRWILGGHLAMYIAALLGWRNERRGTRNRWLFLPYYFLRMNLATLAGARNFIRNREAAQWTKVARG
jgi:poly-beta-1,6-N-acetyl-D-glucosamine synthase